MKPKIFIGSSVEGLSVAYSLQQNLTHDADVTVWDQGVFELSKTTIESLLEVLGKSDFGIFVFNQDDISVIRKENKNVVRDNVLFEFGLFIGKLSRERVFFIIPSETELHLPTDLIGITPGKYDPNRQDKSLQAATGPVCHQIRLQLKKLGVIFSTEQSSEIPEKKELFDNESNAWIDSFLKQEYNQAYEVLKNQLEKETKNDEIIQIKCWMAYCQLKINEFKGIPELEKLLEEFNSHVLAHHNIAWILLREDYIDKSIAVLNNAITQFGEEESFKTLLAECYTKEDGDEKALEFLLSKLPENSVEITLQITNIYKSQREYKKAREVIHKTYINYPNNENLRFNYSLIAVDLNDNATALYLLKSLTQDFPNNSTYWGYLSNCSVSLELYDYAMEACNKANELLDEKQAWIIANIGNILKNKGLYSESIKHLEKALEVDKKYDFAHERLATALKLKQEEEEKVNSISEQGRKSLRQYLTTM